MKTLTIFTFLILSFTGNTSALAQVGSLGGGLGDQKAIIELKPKHPQPGATVEATLSDFRSESYGSGISWLIDGEEVPGTQNRRSITFTAGPAGELQLIEIVLTRPGGLQEVIPKPIWPVYLDLIIEPQTRVPDFYLGRSLPSIGSIVNVTAVITNPKIYTTDLIYTWRINQSMLEGGPVRGRNQISVSVPQGRDSIVSLLVETLDGTPFASKSILIPSIYPKLYFYEVSSLFGIKHKPVISELNMIGNSTIVRAEPYYLDSRVYNNPDIKEWKINNVTSVLTSNNPYEVTLQRKENARSANLEFHVRDTERQVLQGDEQEIRINF